MASWTRHPLALAATLPRPYPVADKESDEAATVSKTSSESPEKFTKIPASFSELSLYLQGFLLF
jgi:hypothetical protein